MSEFSRCFTKLKDKRNLTSAALAEMCEVNRVIIWQWIEGKHLPESWDKLAMVMNQLRLTQKEKDELKVAYECAMEGKHQYNIYNSIKEILVTLKEKRAEYLSQNEVLYQKLWETDVLPNFLKFDNKMDVLKCMQRMTECIEEQERPKIYIKLHTITDTLIFNLKSLCGRSEECNIELVVSTPESKNAYIQENLQLTKSIIDLMMQKTMVQCYCGQGMDELGQAEQNWIVTDNMFMQFTDDMSIGMFTKNQDWIRFFMEGFQQIKKNCSQLCAGKCGALSYVYRSANHQNKIRVIEHMPCFSVTLTERILENGIHKDIPFRNELIQGILRNFCEYVLNDVQDFVSIFELQGVREFMETGMVDVFPYGIYNPIPLPDRCGMLESMIHMAEKIEAWQLLAVKEGIVDLKGIHMETRKIDEKIDAVWLDIHFDNQENKQVELTDEKIKIECWNFFDYLRKYGYVYRKEETLEMMREILKTYQEEL